MADFTRSPAGLEVPRKLGKDFAEREKRVAHATVAAAMSPGHQQVGMSRLGAAGKLLDQGRLALTRITSHKDHVSLTGQRRSQMGVQLGKFSFAGDKDGRSAAVRRRRGEGKQRR